MTLLERLRKVEPDREGERTRWYRNPDGPEAADEIERLRGLFVLVSGFNETPHPCKKEIDDIVDAALQQKESK